MRLTQFLPSRHCFGWTAVLLVCFGTLAPAQMNFNTTQGTLLAKAVPDECYLALGQNVRNDFPPCAAGKIPKVNQGYVWSLVDTGADLWFGTTANPLCTTEGTASSGDIGVTPYQTEAYACEYGVSPYVPPLPEGLGDFRAPRIYVYNKATKVLTDITPKGPVTAANPLGLDSDLRRTIGLRAATRVGNHVIFAGPSLSGGIAMFAFRIDTKQWVAKQQLPLYLNIRQFLEVDGIVYTTVRTLSGTGAVLRYRGSIPVITPPPPPQAPPSCGTCFDFEIVGQLDTEGANIAIHSGRIYVTTWPGRAMAGLFMSPPVPAGGLTRANAGQWIKVWAADNYEPDPVIATSYAGGALMSFGGYLYWGTINLPYASTQAWVAEYGPPANEEEFKQLLALTFRTAVVFRGRNFDTTPEINLLYGAQKLTKYTPGSPGTWTLADNNMPAGTKAPLYGPAGFGNPYTLYIWSMAVWDNKLWVGTFDWSYIVYLSQNIITLPDGARLPKLQPQANEPNVYGGDLYFFPNASSPAVAEDIFGLGNYSSYGVRNLVPAAGSMYVGMANAMNLLTDPNDTLPQGGWELIELQPKPAAARR
jgi:hypothetical protein